MTRRIFCKILLVVVAILGLFVLSGVLSAQGNRDTAFERVKAVQEEHTNRLMAIKGVEGTAIGLDRDNRPALKVFTAGPGVAGIPKTLDGVAVQVVVTGKIYALVDPTAKFPQPVPIGVSTGNVGECSAGTIGCRVTDTQGNVYALSNNHVYALENTASDNSEVLQPGLYDTDCVYSADNVIGTLADFEPIVFHPRANNTIDAAIAAVIKDNGIPRVGTATPEGGYGTPSSTTVEATLGMAVQKYGRTTGLTAGAITGINATVRVRYSSGSARFVGQIIIEPGGFSEPGDSGSLIVTDDDGKNPVGLLFAGSSSMTVANRIDLVLERFVVTVDGDDTPAPPPNDPPTVSITSPVDGSTFDSGATITFQGTATDPEEGDLSASLVWTSSKDGPIGTGGSFSATLSDGTHTITASVTDSGGATGSASVSITVGTPPAEPTTVSVILPSGIDGYATEGGRDGKKHLLITVALEDDFGNPVAGASVSIELFRDGPLYTSGTGTTGTDGTATFKVANAPSGTYITTVTHVTAAGLTWDGVTPENSFTK